MNRRTKLGVAIAAACVLVVASGHRLAGSQQLPDEFSVPGRISVKHQRQHQRFFADQEPVHQLQAMSVTPCVNGFAASYPCDNVDLLSFLPLAEIGGGSGNDIWGWTDPANGDEYALMGRTSGTAFVDISDPENPVYVANLPTHTNNSSWRDIKVHANHAFIVSEADGHGMQVVDLTRLRNITSPPQTLTADAHYSGFGNAHNIVINESTGYAYAVGTSTCAGGLHMIDVDDPTSPVLAGCVSSDGYTHDAQCVTYAGPDTDHVGSEICVNSNEDTVTIVDVTDKAAPVQLSRTGYPGSQYTHQAWLSEDQRFLFLDDELDEEGFGHNTRTRIFDVSDLDSPSLVGFSEGQTKAIDHNLYVVGDTAYQANYRAGLAVLDVSDAANGNLTQLGFFDIYPASDSAQFNGAWSVYPFFDSGTVIVSGIEQGLFVLRPGQGPAPGLTLDNPIPGTAGELNTWTLSGASPNLPVVLALGFATGSQPNSQISICPDLVLDVIPGPFFTVAIADESGDATLAWTPPEAIAGMTAYFQAVDIRSCGVSNVVSDGF